MSECGGFVSRDEIFFVHLGHETERIRVVMLYFLKKYPLSLAVIVAVIYLSFANMSSTGVSSIPHLDKVAHVCMYFGMGGMLWLEFHRAHRRHPAPRWHAWVGAVACPIAFSGAVELLQAYCTTSRSGDWLDFAANVGGVLLAWLVAGRPWWRRWGL